MSTSPGSEMSAGSRSERSWVSGKLSVWSEARGSGEGVGLELGSHAARNISTARSHEAARICGRLPGCAPRDQFDVFGSINVLRTPDETFFDPKPSNQGAAPRSGTISGEPA